MRKIYLFMLLALTATTAKAQQSLDTPKAKPATNITAKGFTANWERVDSAEAYCVFVYDQKPVTRDGETVIIDEDFPYINQGSVIEPAGGDEMYVDLSEKGYTSTYGWSAYGYPNFIPGMVDGLLYSPYLDLRGNDGRYKIVVWSYATDGDTLQVRTHGSRGEQVHDFKHPDGSSPYTYVTSDFSQLVKVDLNDRTSEVVDGISSVKANATADVRNDNVWYNLQGQRVSHPQHGIFIHNGKKVAVK